MRERFWFSSDRCDLQSGIFITKLQIFPAPEIKLKDSNISSVFVPLGKRDEVSRYLMRSVEEHNYDGIALFQVEGREGLYYEKPNWLDKYLRRDRTEWDELCFPHYVKMFDPIHKKEDVDDDENNEENDNEIETNYVEESSDYEKDKAKYGKEVKISLSDKKNWKAQGHFAQCGTILLQNSPKSLFIVIAQYAQRTL